MKPSNREQAETLGYNDAMNEGPENCRWPTYEDLHASPRCQLVAAWLRGWEDGQKDQADRNAWGRQG